MASVEDKLFALGLFLWEFCFVYFWGGRKGLHFQVGFVGREYWSGGATIEEGEWGRRIDGVKLDATRRQRRQISWH